ncbi:hypothetical protein GA0115233_104938 [Streptomyces sp. DI166]|uniref:hypothetical protein n=1 Tax=Streptomyces sp. DI166 TaxID=1839783 RepID=UPI0007F55784|nr:hypothetical protein [Streptomyces sp. DI166]SBT92703.1 hypothetical protein GA0115233_104938 [Streptomyces sp. DI166]
MPSTRRPNAPPRATNWTSLSRARYEYSGLWTLRNPSPVLIDGCTPILTKSHAKSEAMDSNAAAFTSPSPSASMVSRA